MARSEPVKKSVDVEALFQDRLTQVANDTEALLDRLLGPGPLGGRARAAVRGCWMPCAMPAWAPASASGRSWWWRAPRCSAWRASTP